MAGAAKTCPGCGTAMSYRLGQYDCPGCGRIELAPVKTVEMTHPVTPLGTRKHDPGAQYRSAPSAAKVAEDPRYDFPAPPRRRGFYYHPIHSDVLRDDMDGEGCLTYLAMRMVYRVGIFIIFAAIAWISQQCAEPTP